MSDPDSRPWWRDWRQLPPGSRDGGIHPMSGAEVALARLSLVLFACVGIVLLFVTDSTAAPLLLIAMPVAGVMKLPRHQRRQLFRLRHRQ